MHEPGRAARIAGQAAAGSGSAGIRQRARLPGPDGRKGRKARGHSYGRRHCAVALHGEDRPAGQFPLRSVRRPQIGNRADSGLFRHHRQAHCGGIHQKRRGRMDPIDGPGPDGGRGRTGRHHPGLLRLRPVYRRTGGASGGHGNRRHGDSHVQR